MIDYGILQFPRRETLFFYLIHLMTPKQTIQKRRRKKRRAMTTMMINNTSMMYMTRMMSTADEHYENY